MAPRRAPHFLCLAKESKQRKATRRARPAALLNLGGVSLNSLSLKQTRALIRPSLRCSPCPTGGGGREPTAAAAQRRRVVSLGGRGCFAARVRTGALLYTTNTDTPAPLDAQKPMSSA